MGELTSTKIALVTLIESSDDDQSGPKELVDKIRQGLISSGLSSAWSIEKISILEENSPTARIVRAPPEEHLTIP